jgi:hypothetical protein
MVAGTDERGKRGGDLVRIACTPGFGLGFVGDFMGERAEVGGGGEQHGCEYVRLANHDTGTKRNEFDADVGGSMK